MTEATKYTLITGASSGIGRAIALRLACDRNVILHGRDAGRLDETGARCPGPMKRLVWRFDLADTAGLEPSLVGLLKAHDAVVDTFIHSAGLLTLLPLRSMTPAQMSELMNVNFLSAAQIVGALVKKTNNDKQLRNVVFVSSTASKFGAKAFSIYSASKGALDSMMRSLAVELAPQVRVNSVLPGGIGTRMTDGMLSDAGLKERMEKDYPLGLGRAEDVADLVRFLVSDEARWITGQQLVIDGGRTINITA
jgi:NAD(P)-dependent dehydrogenase (short-subunit alcohol dehydrogenase family)